MEGKKDSFHMCIKLLEGLTGEQRRRDMGLGSEEAGRLRLVSAVDTWTSISIHHGGERMNVGFRRRPSLWHIVVTAKEG